MQEGFQLRDVFNPAGVNKLAAAIHQTWPEFDAAGFSADINAQLAPLNFGARNNLIRDKLWDYLPKHFPTAGQILIDSLGPELMVEELTGFDGFMVMPQCDFVAKYGLEYYDLSMKALYEMTKRFTAEGAIRPFIEKYTDQTLTLLQTWAHDLNCHVRRLVSEGTRPRLPLAPRLSQFVKDPRPVLKLLENLKADPILLVRRSVANNLNDIAKDNPDLVVATLCEWQKSPDPGTQWIIGHASRTLVKQGHPEALALLGYPAGPALQVQNLKLEKPVVHLGEHLNFSFDIRSEADQLQNLMIDYVVYFMKANGKQAPKVFKMAKKRLKPGETLSLAKKHPFKPISTRVYYPGEHRLGIQINGQVLAEAEFRLN
jgi:3-methyladenine DNA glycosylase AlkC